MKWETNFEAGRKLEHKTDEILNRLLQQHFNYHSIVYDYTDDRTKATDATLYKLDGSKISISKRVRRFKFIENFGRDFTVRYTELPKYLDYITGPDYMLYCFLSPDESKIQAYYMIDLFHFRFDFMKYRVYPLIGNNDSTKFYIIPVDDYFSAIKQYDLR
jgi:hypothetical protein